MLLLSRASLGFDSFFVVNFCILTIIIFYIACFQNTGKYVPEKTPYLDTFHAVTITMHMFVKVFNLVTHHEELPPINLHDISVGWSCEVK